MWLIASVMERSHSWKDTWVHQKIWHLIEPDVEILCLVNQVSTVLDPSANDGMKE